MTPTPVKKAGPKPAPTVVAYAPKPASAASLPPPTAPLALPVAAPVAT